MNNIQGSTVGGDPINQLPTDQTQPSYNEIKIVDSLFKENKSTINSLVSESKDVILYGLIFIAFSLPQTAEIVSKFVPMAATSVYINVAIRAIGAMVVYWIIKNYYLSRK